MICWQWHGCCCFCGYFWFLCGGSRCGRHRWIRFGCGQRLYRPIDIRWFSGSCVFNELTYNHYPFVNVWLSCCGRCCCERCDIFTIRFRAGVCGRRRWHFCVLLLLVIRLFIIVNFRAQWKWIGFRIVIDGKWFIAGYFVWWWLHNVHRIGIGIIISHWDYRCGKERERVRQREAEKRHGILEKWWKQLVVSHYMMMERAVCLSFFIETRRERRARWHVFLCVYHNSMWKCLPVNHNHRVILVDTVHSIYQMNWQYYRCHRCPELL